jgi:RNA polymerase sigma-70 factor (ECF subfamily)
MIEGPQRGLELIGELDLTHHHLFHAARAELQRRLGALDAAAASYERALSLAANESERRHLARRLSQIK